MKVCSGFVGEFAAERVILILQVPKHRQETTLNFMIFINPHTINHGEFSYLFDPGYNHFCTTGFKSNMVARFKSHSSHFPFHQRS
jgi:hypothetical protein